MDLDLVMRYAALFDGRTDAYGLSHGEVVKEPVTMKLYQRHLEGLEPGLGIFPIRPDATVRFAAVDLDEPNFALAQEIADFIPARVFIERSRSGNAHVWVFFRGSCPAWVARGNLRLALEAAGAPRVEVFPKQTELLPGMVGNYINLPYHGTDRPIIHDAAYPAAGMPLTEFLDIAENSLVDPDHWRGLAIQAGITPPGVMSDEPEVPFGERTTLHECATYMLEHKEDNPLAPGHRHVVLFNLAKMVLNARDYDEQDAVAIVSGYNEAGVSPVSPDEIESLVANAARGQYTSTGCDDPLMSPYISPTCPIAHG